MPMPMINPQRLQYAVLSLLFAVVAIVVVLIWLPYFSLLAVGGILAILFQPVYQKILLRSGNDSMAAWLTMLLVLLIVMVPLYALAQLSFNELAYLYGQYRGSSLDFSQSATVQNFPEPLRGVLTGLSSGIADKLSALAGDAVSSVTGLLSNVAGFFLSFFLVFFTLFYLLRDGQRLKKYLGELFPISETHENLLVSKLERAINGVVKGMFLVAIIQGLVATAGFFIFGVPQPLLWGGFTVLAALVPTVGTSLSLIPAVILLFLTGHAGAALGLGIWGAAAVGTIDNVVSPRLVGSRIDIHPLLVLFSVLGGLELFGFLGVLLGPILMSVFVTLVDIYRNDLREYLNR